MYCVDWSGRGDGRSGRRTCVGADGEFFWNQKLWKVGHDVILLDVSSVQTSVIFLSNHHPPRCRSPLSYSLIVFSYISFSLETSTGISDRGLTLPPWLLLRQRAPQFTNIYWTIPQQTPRLYPNYFIQHRTTLWEQKEGRLPALSAVQSQSQRQPAKCWLSRVGRERTVGFVSQSLSSWQGLGWPFFSFLYTL